MRINILLPAALLLAGTGLKAAGTTDTLATATTSKTFKTVKIGPDFYLPPPPAPKVDSAVLLRNAIDKSYRERADRDITVTFYANTQRLSRQLSTLEVYAKPGTLDVNGLETQLRQATYATDTRSCFLIQNTLAQEYILKGNLDKAGQLLKQSIVIAERSGDRAAILTLASGYAEIAKLARNYDEAASYQLLAQTTATARKDRMATASALLALAELRMLQGDYTLAERMMIRQALPMFRGNKPGRLSVFEHLSELYFKQGRTSEAKWYVLQAKNIADQLKITESQIGCLSRLAAIKLAEGDGDNALLDLRSAETLASEYNFTDHLIGIKGDIGEIYRKMGNYVAAGSFINEYSTLSKNYLGSTR